MHEISAVCLKIRRNRRWPIQGAADIPVLMALMALMALMVFLVRGAAARVGRPAHDA